MLLRRQRVTNEISVFIVQFISMIYNHGQSTINVLSLALSLMLTERRVHSKALCEVQNLSSVYVIISENKSWLKLVLETVSRGKGNV